MTLQYKHNIHTYLETEGKALQKLAFLLVSKVRTNKMYISRQCTYILFV
jgi:hypothetical protein